MDEAEKPLIAPITIDPNKLRHIGMIGVTRAAGFLGLAFRNDDDPLPESVTLKNSTQFAFFSDPLPPETARELVQEFNAWLIGNALQELDRHFSLFTDAIWNVIDITNHHQKSIPSGHVFNDISADTNAANKYEKVCKALEIADRETHMFKSFTNARNCLAHSAGRVGTRHCWHDGRMRIVWFGMDFVLDVAGETHRFDGVLDMQTLPEGDRKVSVSFLERDRYFDVGDVLVLTPRDLHEICLTYARAIDKVIDGLGGLFEKRGIPRLPSDVDDKVGN